jgi:hypothetical protein
MKNHVKCAKSHVSAALRYFEIGNNDFAEGHIELAYLAVKNKYEEYHQLAFREGLIQFSKSWDEEMQSI